MPGMDGTDIIFPGICCVVQAITHEHLTEDCTQVAGQAQLPVNILPLHCPLAWQLSSVKASWQALCRRMLAASSFQHPQQPNMQPHQMPDATHWTTLEQSCLQAFEAKLFLPHANQKLQQEVSWQSGSTSCARTPRLTKAAFPAHAPWLGQPVLSEVGQIPPVHIAEASPPRDIL